MTRQESINALEIDTPSGVINSIFNFFEEELRKVISSSPVLVEESYHAPEIFTCPFCNTPTIEGKITRVEYPNDLIDVIDHHKDCIYLRIKSLSDGRGK